jgi:beta-N-acetylhexosaminidase
MIVPIYDTFLKKQLSLFKIQFISIQTFFRLLKASLTILILSFQCNLCSSDLSLEAAPKIDQLARTIVSKMTDEEKAGQVIHVTLPGKKISPEAILEISKIKPGGIILFGVNLGDSTQIMNFTKEIQEEARNQKLLPLLISTDQEGGRVIRVKKGVTQFPGAMAIGQTAQADYAKSVGFITSYQLAQLGINVMFAPSLDINNNPNNPVINTRSFGSSLEIVSSLGTAYEEGARKGGALPVIKHFPGHGDTNVDSHLGLPIIEKSLEEISSFELIPFQKSIQNGAKALMSAHIVYPKIDSEYPATLSPKILNGILRQKLNFQGLVFSDAMEMEAISKNYKDLNRGVLAIQAGVDVILMTSYGKNTMEYYEMVLEAIRKKKFIVDGVNLLDEAIVRQVKTKIELGLFHSDLSVLKVDEPIINQYIEQKKKLREEEFAKVQKEDPEILNQKISRDSIRSYKTEFNPISLGEIEKYEFVVKNKKFHKILRERNGRIVSEKSLKKLLKKNTALRLVFDSNDKADIDRITNLLKNKSYKECILLHTGNPFLEFPKIKNVKILFSFSPTKQSLKALIEKGFSDETTPIPPADLIFSDSMDKNLPKKEIGKLKNKS